MVSPAFTFGTFAMVTWSCVDVEGGAAGTRGVGRMGGEEEGPIGQGVVVYAKNNH